MRLLISILMIGQFTGCIRQPLATDYSDKAAYRSMNKQIDTIPAETMRALARWHWPGNIRELENFIERAVILSRGSVLNVPVSELQAMAPASMAAAAAAAPAYSQPLTLEDSEREHILKILRETKGIL